jgi:hypothetical protein
VDIVRKEQKTYLIYYLCIMLGAIHEPQLVTDARRNAFGVERNYDLGFSNRRRQVIASIVNSPTYLDNYGAATLALKRLKDASNDTDIDMIVSEYARSTGEIPTLPEALYTEA